MLTAHETIDTTPQRLRDYIDAEAALADSRRFSRGAMTFRSAASAVAWFIHNRDGLSAGRGMSFRLEAVGGHWEDDPKTGGANRVGHSLERVTVDEGGGRGDLDEARATVTSIEACLKALPAHVRRKRDAWARKAERRIVRTGRPSALTEESYPYMLQASHAGWTESDIADDLGVHRATVGRHLARAEAALAELLREGGVLA